MSCSVSLPSGLDFNVPSWLEADVLGVFNVCCERTVEVHDELQRV